MVSRGLDRHHCRPRLETPAENKIGSGRAWSKVWLTSIGERGDNRDALAARGEVEVVTGDVCLFKDDQGQ